MTLDTLKTLIQTPDLASKKWIREQYDSQVMNDTIQTGGDAAIVRIHNSKKAIAASTDCTPRYVKADPFEGAKQAVAETYRNISAVGAKPLAITNCLNFGNPQKPEIMGEIVRAIKGITEASKVLDYPVVSGNVSLYNETDGEAIKPTPAIGGVGLLKDYEKRSQSTFRIKDDVLFVIGQTQGHLDCSLYNRDIAGVQTLENPPKVNLEEEKKNAEFIRHLIEQDLISACHDISDGGLLVALFEMCTDELGCHVDIAALKEKAGLDDNQALFGEDQARYVIAINPQLVENLESLAEKASVEMVKVGSIIADKLQVLGMEADVKELIKLNESVFPQRFS